MNVKTAFLNGSLGENVYMDQLEGFSIKGKEHLACKLKMSIYGLKQASWQWYPCERLRPGPFFLGVGPNPREWVECVIASQNGGSTDYIYPFRLRVLQSNCH